MAGALLAEASEAALEILRLLAVPGVAHEVERKGGVDLDAGPRLVEDLETGRRGDGEKLSGTPGLTVP